MSCLVHLPSQSICWVALHRAVRLLAAHPSVSCRCPPFAEVVGAVCHCLQVDLQEELINEDR